MCLCCFKCQLHEYKTEFRNIILNKFSFNSSVSQSPKVNRKVSSHSISMELFIEAFSVYYIFKSCRINFVFCRMGNGYCRIRKMVATFMPMYFVSMILDPVENIVAINVITSNYIWTKQTFPKPSTEPFLYF